MGESELIDSLVSQGATDEEIEVLLNDFRSKRSGQPSQPTPQQQTEAPSEEEGFLSKVGRNINAFATQANSAIPTAAADIITTAQGTSNWLLEKLGVPNPGALMQNKKIEEGYDKIEEAFPYDPNANELVQNVGRGVGQLEAMLMTGGASAGASAIPAAAGAVEGTLPMAGRMIAGAAKRMVTAAPTAQGVVAGSMGAAPEWRAAKEAGLSDEDAFQSLLQNYFVGQMEAIPLSNTMGRLDKIFGGKIMSKVKEVGISGLEEALQESIQTYTTNVLAQNNYDPDRDPMFEVLQSAVTGGIAGMFLPGVSLATSRLGAAQRAKVERKLAEVQANGVINNTTTGDVEMDAEIDNNAALTPQERALLDQKNAIKAQVEEDTQTEKVVKSLEKTAKEETKAAQDAIQSDIVQKGPQAKSGINREATSDYSEEDFRGVVRSTSNLLDALARSDGEEIENKAQELFRQQENKGRVYLNPNSGRIQIRTSSGDGTTSGENLISKGASASQESQRPRQQAGELGTSESGGPLKTSLQGEKSKASAEIKGDVETKTGTMVEAARLLYEMQSKGQAAYSARSLQTLLDKAVRENQTEAQEIIDVITSKLQDYGVQINTSRKVDVGEQTSTSSEVGDRGKAESAEKVKAAEVDPYEVGTRKLKELTDMYADPDLSAENQELIYKQLQETRNALNQLRPTATKNNTTQIQKQINEDTGVTRKQEPITIRNVASALKEQIKQHYKTLEEGVRKGQKMTNETLIKKVQEMTKGANLSPRQMSTILTKVRNTNLFTPGSVSKLGTFVDKVVADAEYADKITEANNIKTRLKSLSKQSTSLKNQAGLAKNFSKINPEDVDIDEHLRVGRSLVSGMSPVATNKYSPVNTSEVAEYIDSIPQEDDEVATKEIVKEARKSPERRQQLEASLSASIEALNAKDLSGFDESETKVIESIKNLDPSKLSNEHLATAIRVTDNIVENDDLSNTGKINAVITSRRNMKTAVDSTKRLKKRDIKTIGKVSANNYQLFGRVFGDARVAAMIQRLMGYADVISAGSRTEAKRTALAERINSMAKSIQKAYKVDIKDVNNEVQLAAFSELYKNYGDNAHIPKVIAQIKQSADEYGRNGYEQDADAWNKAYEQFKDVKTVEEARAKISEPLFMAWKFFNNTFNNEVVDKLEDLSGKLYNKQFIRADNYTHTEHRKLSSTSESRGLKESSGQGQPTVNPQQSTTAITAVRSLPEGSAYSSNFLDSQLRGYSKSIYDIEASDAKALLNESLKTPEFVELMGSQENAKIIDKMIKTSVELQEGVTRQTQNEAWEAINSVLNTVRGLGAVRALGSVFQPIKQVPSVLTKTLINHATSGSPVEYARAVLAINLFGRNASLDKLFNNYSIGVRENRKGGIERGDTLSRKEFTSRRAGSNPILNLAGKLDISNNKLLQASMYALTKSDAYAAKVSWLSYYLKSLKEQGVGNVNVTEEYLMQNDERRQQAAAYAEQMVAETQLPSNPSTLSQLSRYDGNQASTLLKSILLPFSTYTINAKYRMIQDFDRMKRNPNTENVGAVVGDLTEIATYAAVMYGMAAIVRPQIKDFVELLTSAIGVEDEEETEEKARQRFWETAFHNVSPFSIGSFGEAFTAWGVNKLAYAAGNEGQSYEDWKKETGGFLQEKDTKLDWSVVGTGASVFTDPIDGVSTAITDDDLTEEEKNALILNTVMSIFAGFGLMDAEFHNQAKKVYKEQTEIANEGMEE